MSVTDEIADSERSAANPLTAPSFLGTVAPGIHVVGGMGNALSIETPDGVIQLDTGNSAKKANEMLTALREITDAPILAILYSHGHVGYNDGVRHWLARRGPPRRVT